MARVKNTINEAALVSITSSASDESDKTFTVVGTGMDGASLAIRQRQIKSNRKTNFKTITL